MIRVAAFGMLSAALGSCGARTPTTQNDIGFATRIVVPPCDETGPRVELLKVRRDLSSRGMPSRDAEPFLLDLRIHTGNAKNLWLLVDHDTFPSGVDEVSRMPDGEWLFSGNDNVFARSLGAGVDPTIQNLSVYTGRSRIPLVLGQIQVENIAPQRWVEQGGFSDHRTTFGGKLARSGIEVVCVDWIDLRAHTDSDGGP